MIAVHDQRLDQQEKQTDDLHVTVEKRREEFDVKLKDVYDTMRDQDNHIVEEISKLRTESTAAHKELGERITKLEKYIWVAMGGGITLTWLATNLFHYLKIFP